MSDLDGTVKALVTEALFKAIDEKKRDELIKSALGALMEKNTRGYPYSDSNNAVAGVLQSSRSRGRP